MSDPLIEAAIRRLSNWGRWGAEDEIGTVNLITPGKRREAAELVVTGETYSLAIPFDRDGPQPHRDRRLNPQHTMLQTGTDLRAGVQELSVDGWGYADDMFCMAAHGATHWDSLAHAFWDYRMYNDRPCTLVDAAGAHRNSISRLSDRIVTRAVLLDLPRALGLEWLDQAHRITVAEIERTLEQQRAEVRAGDIVLLRTGNMKRARRDGDWDGYTYADEPGPGFEALAWFHREDIAGAATDTWAFEVTPSESERIWLPLHAVGITHMGMLFGENFHLDVLAEACERLQRWEFMLAAPSLPLTGATASPINPLAIF
ncbi:MAG: cyclase family protein [Actinobacteria bacterium]|nr:cyclase family protein [Actinomycetota bacterium]